MRIAEENGERVAYYEGADDALAAHFVIMEVIERHMTREEAIPVCIDLAFADPHKLGRALALLIGNERLRPEQLAERLRRLPATMRALEGPAS